MKQGRTLTIEQFGHGLRVLWTCAGDPDWKAEDGSSAAVCIKQSSYARRRDGRRGLVPSYVVDPSAGDTPYTGTKG